jgi:hypothetical protein
MTLALVAAAGGAPSGTWTASFARAGMARPMLIKLERPVVSFSFDGFARSAAVTGAGVLEAAGKRGTFYACAGLAEQTVHPEEMFGRADLARLIERRHEIGCHTTGDADCARLPPDFVLADTVLNAHALGELGLDAPLVSFAYPHGRSSSALRRALPRRFLSGRSRRPGVNVGLTDFAHLRANGLLGDQALRRALAVVTQAVRCRGWAIFFAHGVSTRPGILGCETRVLERVLMACVVDGVEVAPVGEIAARVTAHARR